jgi:glycosyltransferase involved in cell wall biosynthesis
MPCNKAFSFTQFICLNTERKKLARIVTVPISFKHLIKGQARYFSEHGYEVSLISADGPELPAVIAHEKVPHYTIPFTRQITLIQDLKCCWQLYKTLKRIKPDVLHTQTPKAGLLGQLVGWWCGVPLRLHTVGGLPLMEAKGWKRKLLELVEKITYAGAHIIMPNSRSMADFMVKQGLVRQSKLRILGQGSSNGIDTDFFQPKSVALSVEAIRQQHQIPVTATVFVFIGRLVRDKGIVELVTAFKNLAARYNDIYLLLVGPLEQHLDPLPEEVLETIAAHERIVSAGYQEDVRPWLKMSDILCFPSYREGFPNVPMQAGAMGLGLIVSDINGCNEIVTDGDNGWIIAPKQTEALQQAMEFTLLNPKRVAAVRGRVRQSIVDRFGQQQIWAALADVYQTSDH